MDFKEYFIGCNLTKLNEEFMGCFLFERENDIAFRELATSITEHIISNIQDTQPKYFPDVKLFFDFQEMKESVRGCFVNEEQRITINILNNKELFYNNIKKFMEENRYILFHEVVHFIDYLRGSKYRTSSQGPIEPSNVNTPLEFNAYYHTFVKNYEDALKKIYGSGDRNEAFAKIMGNSVNDFIKRFWEVIKIHLKDTEIYSEIMNDEKYKFKWNKRLFQFYYEMLDKVLNKSKRIDKKSVKKI